MSDIDWFVEDLLMLNLYLLFIIDRNYTIIYLFISLYIELFLVMS